MILVVVGAVLVIAMGLVLALGRPENANEADWEAFFATEPEGLAKLLSGPAKRLAGSNLVQGVNPSSMENMLGRLQLGGAFGGSLQIFLAYQMAAVIVSGALLAVVALAPLPTLFRFVFAGLAALIVLWPYSTTKTAAAAKEIMIRKYLPDFAELLLMVLPSMSVPQALNFTAGKLTGPVAVEMRELVRTLNLRTMPEDQAFDMTSQRLGTIEGRQFVTALKVAYLDGAKAVEPIRAQVDSLRNLQYQHQRAQAKKLPVKMVVSFAMHFMPMLFILAFLPVFYGLMGAV